MGEAVSKPGLLPGWCGPSTGPVCWVADWRPRLDDQIRRIELLRDRLDGCIGCGCLSLRSCALTNPGDDLAERGPGAVLLDPDKRPW